LENEQFVRGLVEGEDDADEIRKREEANIISSTAQYDSFLW